MTSPVRRPEPDPADEPPARGGERVYVGHMTREAFRRYDEHAEYRHEYVDGAVYAMSTGTRVHSRIAGNVFFRLHALTLGTGCQAHTQGFTVLTPRKNEYVPDVVVECGAPDAPYEALYVETPCLIVEVLSPGTARTDLTEKVQAYGSIATARAYLVVDAAWRRVRRYWREDAGDWQVEEIVGHGSIPLPCPAGGVLTLDEVYANLNLPSTPPPPPRPILRRVREVPVPQA